MGSIWKKFLQGTARRRFFAGLAVTASSVALLSLGAIALVKPPALTASDHDDGDTDMRSRALSLTDLYVFREQDQNPGANADNLVLIMNTNPRSLARVEYYFSTEAQYNFNIARVGNKDASGSIRPDITLRVTFGRPENGQQQMFLSVIERGKSTRTISRTVGSQKLSTTALAAAANPTLNRVRDGANELTVFAGLREDPFFFDVEQFFRVRAGLLGQGPSVGFRPPEEAVDFTTGYNVNSIAIRVPRSFLQGDTQATVFDVWLSINTRDPRYGFQQTEHLARPGVNEALQISQENYALYNRIMPTGTPNTRLAQVAKEATQVLTALGNNNARTSALLAAFVPDVMRIDTSGPSGYANDLNALGAPIRGRLLTDDVIDITLAVLTNGAVVTDNVSYAGTPGNPAQGHDPLQPSFPYLALPN